jgi:hypothetical protein
MKTTMKIEDLIGELSNATKDQLPDLDLAIAAEIQGIDATQIPAFFERMNQALVNNEHFPDYTEKNPEQAEERGGLSFHTGANGQAEWAEVNGAIGFGDIVKVKPNHFAEPTTLEELIQLIKKTPDGSAIDVLGAGLSLNGLYAQHSQYLILTNALNRKLPFDRDLYHKDPKKEYYYQTEAGVRIPKLLDDIYEENMALSWGGYTPQSLVGAAVTSTHKSGFLAPLVDYILSADVVQSDGKVYRIEPTDGITNRATYEYKYAEEGRVLIQDDHIFYATINRCSVGIIYSVILQASPPYSLVVKRVYYDQLSQAEEEIARILQNECAGNGPWQLDLWVMPKSKKTILVIHDKIPYDPTIRSNQPSCLCSFLLSAFGQALWNMAYDFPSVMEDMIEKILYLQATSPDGEKLDWRHYMGGNIPPLKMMATEKMIDYHGDERTFDRSFIDLINEIGEKTKDLYYNSPMGVRFVGASKHALSMFKKEGVKRFVSFEQPFVPHSQHGQRILRIIDEVLSAGRTHWGQNNLIEENRGLVAQQYGRDLEHYLAVRQQLLQGKPDRFKLPRDLDVSLPTPVDPARYYRIRENTKGGYLTVLRGGEHKLKRQPYGDTVDQYFYFTPLEAGWYHIRTVDHRYWTVEDGVFPITYKNEPQGDNSKFRLEALEDGSYRIHELTAKQLLYIGNGGSFDGLCIRLGETNETPDRQRFWLHDAGPLT